MPHLFQLPQEGVLLGVLSICHSLGTVRDLVGAGGELINTVTYDSFGNILSQTDAVAGCRVPLLACPAVPWGYGDSHPNF